MPLAFGEVVDIVVINDGAGSVPELAFGYVAGAPGLASEWWIPYVSGFGTSNGTTMVSYDDDARGRG